MAWDPYGLTEARIVGRQRRHHWGNGLGGRGWLDMRDGVDRHGRDEGQHAQQGEEREGHDVDSHGRDGMSEVGYDNQQVKFEVKMIQRTGVCSVGERTEN